jgi:hypothetical protein
LVCNHQAVTIDLGELNLEEFDPGELVVAPERRRRAVLTLLLAAVVLIGAAGSRPPGHAVQASALADLADAEQVDIAGDIAVGVLPDTGEVVAVSLRTGNRLWRRDPGFNGRPNVQIAGSLVILDAGAGSPRNVSIVDLQTGRQVDRSDGSVVAPAVDGVQAVRRVDETGSTVRAIGPGGTWVAAWPPDASPIPAYAQGFRAPAVVAMASDGGVGRLDLLTGTWTALGRMRLGDIPLGLFDGRLQVRQDRRGAGYIALYDTAGGKLTELWRDRLSGSDPPRLIPCGAYLCGGTFGSTTAYDLADGHTVWSANGFRITGTEAGARGAPVLTGVVTDEQRRSQEALLDPATGRLLAVLGAWRLGGVIGGQALVYRPGVAGRAWLGELALDSPAAGVRTTLHLPVPAQHCDFGERWAVCVTGVADQPPYAVIRPEL